MGDGFSSFLRAYLANSCCWPVNGFYLICFRLVGMKPRKRASRPAKSSSSSCTRSASVTATRSSRLSWLHHAVGRAVYPNDRTPKRAASIEPSHLLTFGFFQSVLDRSGRYSGRRLRYQRRDQRRDGLFGVGLVGFI